MNYSEYPVTFSLIALNVIFSLIGLSSRELVSRTVMWPYGVKRQKQLYRFITSGFLHADLMHLFFNMFTLYFFGRNIEYLFTQLELGGTFSYLALYFGALVISDIPSYLKNCDNPNYHSLGASGAVSAIIFGSIIFSPWDSVYLYGAIKLSALLFAVLYIAYCIYMGRQNRDNINHDAHLWGAILGLVYTLLLIAVKNPELFSSIIEELKKPSLFGH